MLCATLLVLGASMALADADYSATGADTCLICHRDDLTLAVFRGAHGRPDVPHAPFGSGGLQCESCHGPGGRHSRREDRDQAHPDIVNSASTATERNAGCVDCHADSAGLGWHGSAHDLADLACADCHRVHIASEDAMAENTADACLVCHTRQRTAMSMPFTHPIEQGSMTCSDCHAVHGGGGEYQLIGATVNDTCYACHQDKRGPVLWEHAPVEEDCSLCHDSHGSPHPAMLTRRGPFLCQACHSQAGHPALRYDGELLPGGSAPSAFMVGNNCVNCHSQVHGSNHPSGSRLMR